MDYPELLYVEDYEGVPAWFKAVPNSPGHYKRIVYVREGTCKRKCKELRAKMRTVVKHLRERGEKVKVIICCVPDVEDDSSYGPSLGSDFPIMEDRPTLKPYFTDDSSDEEPADKEPGAVFRKVKTEFVRMAKRVIGCLVPGACCIDEELLLIRDY